MGKSHPVELRQRVVDHVAEGNTHRSTAARFKVSVKFVNDMFKLERVAFNQVHLIERDSQHYQRLACLGLHSI